jgi:tRNA pseudouridine55 synthase
MGVIKRKYRTKKVGFSGTLDPFATGCLIVATGRYTKLFQYLKKTPKTYQATLWLGAKSESLDIENILEVTPVKRFDLGKIEETLQELKGQISYTPPKFSAKKVDGKRAYDLARAKKEVKLKEITSEIYNIELINYSHPFLTFKIVVSEGSYIRSLGEIIAQKLGCNGALSALARVREGEFYFDKERALDPLKYLEVSKNIYLGDEVNLTLGKKLGLRDFKEQSSGVYFVEFGDYFAIIEIADGAVKYRLNLMPKFKGD